MVNGHLGLYLSTQSALYNLPHSPIFKGFFPHGFSTYSPTFTHTFKHILRVRIFPRDIWYTDWFRQGLNHQPTN